MDFENRTEIPPAQTVRRQVALENDRVEQVGDSAGFRYSWSRTSPGCVGGRLSVSTDVGASVVVLARDVVGMAVLESEPRPASPRHHAFYPTPARIATIMDPSNATEVATVTNHKCRSRRNIGRPIKRMAPKNSVRYGTRMRGRIGDLNSIGQA